MNAFVLSLSTLIDAGCASVPIQNGIRILQADLSGCLTGTGPANTILLTKDRALGEEAYGISVSEDCVSIRYADDLGAIYALLFISERFLGIKPMDWWNDVEPDRKATAAIPCGEYTSSSRAVRYRGWFVNDEVLLDGWHPAGAQRTAMWEKICETLLRCGGNMIILGTDRASEGLDMLASDMGLILTQHHAELLGAEMFGRVWPSLPGSYRLYPDKFEQLWLRAAQKYRGRKVIYTIGFRAQGDAAFWAEDQNFDTPQKRGAEISRILRRQMEIVRSVSPEARFCTNLYGEMMPLYRQGVLDIPEEVIKIWADNGFGKMVSRRQGSYNPRADAMPRGEKGENGIYFHVGFYDLQAANHLTQLQISPFAVADELKQVLGCGADQYWIINCGSVKPHIYFLDLIRELWTNGTVDVQQHAQAYARAYFGDEAVGALLLRYSACAVRYGENTDDMAGDQYYHFAIREAVWQMMRGCWDEAKALSWAERGDLMTQLDLMAARCAPAIGRWQDYLAFCRDAADRLAAAPVRLLRSTLEMNAEVHLSGCIALTALAAAAHALHERDYIKAFYHAGRALEGALRGCKALKDAEFGKWNGYYANDCFTNLGLTADVLRGFMRYIRILGDGPYFWNWEKSYLMAPEDVRVMLQTHRHCQLSDEALYAALKARGVFETEEQTK